jgi:NAD(P)-dependent dehydrogenase (short-subunit alcohol dehydrogenase family)
MLRKIEESVVVITGASSGLGRATALAFACEGATVVLGARREEALRKTAEECEQAGGRALAVPADVTNEEDIRALAGRAEEVFGRIDVWINNAGVYCLGRFDAVPVEIHRRVIETNLLGVVYGSHAALSRFRRQGHGVLINVSSILAKVPMPYTNTYIASKHGILGLGKSLRQELYLEGTRDIHVCTVMSATLDTPLLHHTANYTGRNVRAVPPVYAAERAAMVILDLARRPRRETFVGTSAPTMSLQQAFWPGVAEAALAIMADRLQLGRKPAPRTAGNLFEPTDGWTGISGGWSRWTGGYRFHRTASRKAAYEGLAAAAGAASRILFRLAHPMGRPRKEEAGRAA